MLRKPQRNDTLTSCLDCRAELVLRADSSCVLCKLQLLTDVHLPLLELVVEEAFEAAIDVAGQENLDVRLHEMRYAMPALKVVIQSDVCAMHGYMLYLFCCDQTCYQPKACGNPPPFLVCKTLSVNM